MNAVIEILLSDTSEGAVERKVGDIMDLAADGFKAPGVVVSFTTDPGIQSGKKFVEVGLQAASGVPLQCDEGPDIKTCRLGLFGLEKWHNVDRTVQQLATALDAIAAKG